MSIAFQEYRICYPLSYNITKEYVSSRQLEAIRYVWRLAIMWAFPKVCILIIKSSFSCRAF